MIISGEGISLTIVKNVSPNTLLPWYFEKIRSCLSSPTPGGESKSDWHSVKLDGQRFWDDLHGGIAPCFRVSSTSHGQEWRTSLLLPLAQPCRWNNGNNEKKDVSHKKIQGGWNAEKRGCSLTKETEVGQRGLRLEDTCTSSRFCWHRIPGAIRGRTTEAVTSFAYCMSTQPNLT